MELTQHSEKQHQDRIAELEKIVADNQRHNVECNDTKVDCDETMGINTGEQVAQLHDEIVSFIWQVNMLEQILNRDCLFTCCVF